MFNVLLYTWVTLTVLLLGAILYNVVHRFLQLKNKDKRLETAKQLPVSEDVIAQAMNEEITEIVHENDDDNEELVSEEEIYDEEVLTSEPQDEDSIPLVVTEDVEQTDAVEEISQPQAVSPITTDEVSVDEDIVTDEAPAIVIEKTIELEQTVGSATTKQYEYLFVSETKTPEIPKNIDENRNIAKGHSRDDIIRDKFEKHVQKIRYEIGILKQRNDILGYEKKLVEGITLLPNDTEFQKQLSDLYFNQGKYKKAQSLLKKILIENPNDHNALWQVGEIASVEGNTEDSFLYLQQAYALCDDNPKYCFSLAQRYYDHDALDQSLPLMEKIVKLRPKNIDYLVSLSHVQHKLGDIEAAKQSLLRALELDPINITLKNYLKALVNT